MCKTQLDSFHSLLLRSTKHCCLCTKRSPGTTLGWVWYAGLGWYAGSWRKIKLWENSLQKWEVTLKAVEPGCQPGATSVGAWGLTAVNSARWKMVKKCHLTRAGKAEFWCPTVRINLLLWDAAGAQPWLWHTELTELRVQELVQLQGGGQGGHLLSTANRTRESCLDLCFLWY